MVGKRVLAALAMVVAVGGVRGGVFGAAVTPEADGFANEDVRIVGGVFGRAQEMGEKYILELDVDRLLAPFYEASQLTPQKPRYGGWESQGVSGHILGHWLSAASRMYADTGDADLKKRMDYAVSELAILQGKRADGYVSGFPDDCFQRVFSGDFRVEDFNLGGQWVPWYTMHKIFAGLIDAYQIGGSAQALEVVKKLGEWADAGVSKMNDAQVQRMLQCEQGGMCESFAQLYEITGDQKYLALAKRFTHHRILDPLAKEQDHLAGIHANAQIPKIVGAAVMWKLTGDDYYNNVAHYFWDEVTGKRSYVFGGNSLSEHFQRLGTEPLGPTTAETCNTYNMLRLTKELMTAKMESRYGDYYERALYNHILASQDPDSGLMTYFLSTKPGHFKVYSTAFDSMWCCTGTGMENPGRYNEGIYFHGDDTLWVNLYIASELKWKEKGLMVRQETAFPEEGRTKLTVEEAPAAEMAMEFRVPYWVEGKKLNVRVNGEAVADVGGREGWFAVKRAWKGGDVVEIELPMGLHVYRAVDDAEKVSLMVGPIVLAAEMGRANFPADDHFKDQNAPNNYPAPAAPLLVSDSDDPAAWVSPMEGEALTFKTRGTAEGGATPGDVTFVPFYKVAHERYTVYVEKMTTAQWTEREKSVRAAQLAAAELDKRTVDLFDPGEQQADIDHAWKGEQTSTGNWNDKSFRHAENGGWFSYQVKVSPERANILRVTYWGGESGSREFAVVVDGTVVGEQKLLQNAPGKFFDVDYAIPKGVTKGKEKVEVKFAAKPENLAGGVFGVRMMTK